MARFLRWSVLGAFAIICATVFFPVSPVLAVPTQSTGACVDAAKAQLGVKLSQITDLSCYTDSAQDCTANARTIITGNGLCPSGQFCCAAVKKPACDAEALQIDKTTLKSLGCAIDNAHCVGDGGTAVPSSGCTGNAVCCYIKSKGPQTCAQIAKEREGAEGQGICYPEPGCPAHYNSVSGNVQTPTDCKQGEHCCFIGKTGQAAAQADCPTGMQRIFGATSNVCAPKGSAPDLIDPLNGATIFQVINRVIRVFLGMVGALTFAVFFYAGVTWMTAGSSERIKTARNAMKYAVIGLLLIGFSFAITNFIIDALANRGSVASPATQQQEAPVEAQELQP